jgi:hypothetical protein
LQICVFKKNKFEPIGKFEYLEKVLNLTIFLGKWRMGIPRQGCD